MPLLYLLTLASLAYAAAAALPTLLPAATAALPSASAFALGETPDVTASLCRNIFDDSGSFCAPRPQRERESPTDLAKCEEPRLLGIVHGRRARRALFAGAGVVKEGDEFLGYSLLEVHPQRAVLSQGDARCETRLFDPGPEGAANEGNQREGNQSVAPGLSLREGRLQVPRSLVLRPDARALDGLRGVPTASGIRLHGVRRGSIFSRAGFRNGDLITKVQGRALTPDTVVELMTELAEARRIRIEVQRGSQTLQQEADLSD